MSQAFVKESDDQWLDEVAPTLKALTHFLIRENNGINIHEQKSFIDANGREIHVMSNGASYFKNSNGRWEIL